MSKRRRSPRKTNPAEAPPTEPTGAWRKHGLSFLLALAFAGLCWVLYLNLGLNKSAPPLAPSLPSPPQASYVGADHCGSCHQQALDDWKGSHHDLAMQSLSAESVLGDFDGTSFTADGITTQFFRNGNDYRVRTDNVDGELQDFAVRYTFGAYPLQQYLVEFPDGRLQVLGIAWDSRAEEVGGQRWFKLYADQNVDHQHPLHWTQSSQNWNFMCAECHSTHLEKNYDQRTRSYNTTWSDIDVACEACHGPGSSHLLWANPDNRDRFAFGERKGLTHLFTERHGVHWSRNADNKPVRSKALTSTVEIEVCAACHSRRSQPLEDDRTGQPLMNSFLPATLDDGLYHADGQVDDEVFVYGSFAQSAMFAAGVTCSDCHNPHSLALNAEGNGVCLQCHEARYDSEAHHFHPAGSPGSECAQCHMPARTFMTVDSRRDHSFRIPRPDLSERLGVPNTCNSCHEDRSPAWASQQLQQWYGHPPEGHQQFAPALAAGRQHSAEAGQPLMALLTDRQQPAIARATAARLLGQQLDSASVDALAAALRDNNPQIRQASIEALLPLPVESRWQLFSPLLEDPHRVVRITAAEALADVPVMQLPGNWPALLQAGFREFEQAQTHNADTPGAQVKLGNYLSARGYDDRAEQAYGEALMLDKRWTPAYVNLADLYRRRGRDAEGRALLERGLTSAGEPADLHYALGLLEVRQKQLPAALPHLQKAASLQPQNSTYQSTYAVALDANGETAAAIRWLAQAMARQPSAQLLALKQQLEAK